MKLYEYMIIYTFSNDFSKGIGRLCISKREPIRSYDYVESLDKFINDTRKLDNVFITDFKLLRVYEEKENERDSK